MLKKMILASILGFTSLFGFKVGDKLDTDTIHVLQLSKDKIYVLDFFASWCASCKIELPLISKVASTINTQKYEIIGIDVDKDISKGKAFIQKLDINFPIIYDSNSQFISKFNPIGVPAIYYIKDLKIEKVIFGAVHNIDKKILQDMKKLGE